LSAVAIAKRRLQFIRAETIGDDVVNPLIARTTMELVEQIDNLRAEYGFDRLAIEGSTRYADEPAAPAVPDPARIRDSEILQEVLSLVEEYHIPQAAITALSDEDYWRVQDWAASSIAAANDNDVEIPPRPAFIAPYAEALAALRQREGYAAASSSFASFITADQASAHAGAGEAAGGPAECAGPAGVPPTNDGPGG
jgi:hypothetical protein